jgi:hypothetical protein
MMIFQSPALQNNILPQNIILPKIYIFASQIEIKWQCISNELNNLLSFSDWYHHHYDICGKILIGEDSTM